MSFKVILFTKSEFSIIPFSAITLTTPYDFYYAFLQSDLNSDTSADLPISLNAFRQFHLLTLAPSASHPTPPEGLYSTDLIISPKNRWNNGGLLLARRADDALSLLAWTEIKLKIFFVWAPSTQKTSLLTASVVCEMVGADCRVHSWHISCSSLWWVTSTLAHIIYFYGAFLILCTFITRILLLNFSYFLI